MNNEKYNNTVKRRENIKAMAMIAREGMYFWPTTK
jgi:hypothetical protein